MGILQKAYETFEYHKVFVGKTSSGDREFEEPLAPVGHITTKAQIEITLDPQGKFVSARTVDKNEKKIIIPVTEESSGRTSKASPHPLCDNLGYLSPEDTDKNDAYIEALAKWAESEFSHPMLSPILAYIKGGTILEDLAKAGIEKYSEKDMVRWSVIGLDGDSPNCWNSFSLFDAFTRYYQAKKETSKKVLCMVTGEEAPEATQHLKGIVSVSGNAKLISANDSVNFTYRGRFRTPEETLTVGYEASQKAHNALKWLASDQGVIIGGRTFLCWNPKGKKLLRPTNPVLKQSTAIIPEDYQKELRNALYSYRSSFSPTDEAVIAVFDAATTGRLALTYYNEMLAHDFLDKLEHWDTTCCFSHGQFGMESPSLDRIITCAFGTDRETRIEAEERIRKQQLQRLLSCRLDGTKFPYDIMHALIIKTMNPLAYSAKNYDYLQFTACAVTRKYYIDQYQEEYAMSLEKDRKDLSYQYGRLLAILEKAEKDTYDGEGREPNAIRMQAAFCAHPMQTAKNIIEQVKIGYYPKLSVGARNFYDRLIGEIYEKISEFPEAQWNAPLKETYIMGYYLQKNALYTKNHQETEKTEE